MTTRKGRADLLKMPFEVRASHLQAAWEVQEEKRRRGEAVTQDDEIVSNGNMRPADLFVAIINFRVDDIRRALRGDWIDVNAPIDDHPAKRTPLSSAVCTGSLDVVRAVLDGGSHESRISKIELDLLDKDKDGERVECVSSFHNVRTRYALYEAVFHASFKNAMPESLSILEFLLARGADPNAVWTETGRTLLHVVAMFQHRAAEDAVVELLCRYGASLDATCLPFDPVRCSPERRSSARLNPRRGTVQQPEEQHPSRTRRPIHVARYASTCVVMARYGADLDDMSDDGMTPLRNLVLHSDAEEVRALLEAGASVAYHDPTRSAPISDAIDRCDPDFLWALLEHGAPVHEKYAVSYGMPGTPLEIATARRDTEGRLIIELFMAREAAAEVAAPHLIPDLLDLVLGYIVTKKKDKTRSNRTNQINDNTKWMSLACGKRVRDAKDTLAKKDDPKRVRRW